MVRGVLARRPDLFFSVSVTTRNPRPGEADGVHYRFVSEAEFEELARRLRARGTEAGAALDRRLAEARREMAEADRFDHVVVNDRVERAVDEVLAIIDGGRERA